jgi:hypothetical protein
MEVKMNQKFKLSTNSNSATDFAEGDTTIINFSRCRYNNEYRLTFLNKNKYNTLKFTLLSNLKIECYFEYIKLNGHSRFVGYHNFKEKETVIDIHDCTAFVIVIPRKLNTEVYTPLTLAYIEAL